LELESHACTWDVDIIQLEHPLGGDMMGWGAWAVWLAARIWAREPSVRGEGHVAKGVTTESNVEWVGPECEEWLFADRFALALHVGCTASHGSVLKARAPNVTGF
jgi:hypothetical protein